MSKSKIVASFMVVLMAILQGVYAVYAFVDPSAFSELRGTELFSEADSDWVLIYASRTMFVALIIGFLLLRKEFNILMWAALFGTVMPITDAWLARESGADSVVFYKHIATVVYLLIIFSIFRYSVNDDRNA